LTLPFHSDAGSWFFRGRKWIDPAIPDGRAKLDLHHFNLCTLFPPFAEACPHARFIDAIATAAESWSRPMRAVAEAGRCRTIADFAPDSPPNHDTAMAEGAGASADPSVEETGGASAVGSEDMRTGNPAQCMAVSSTGNGPATVEERLDWATASAVEQGEAARERACRDGRRPAEIEEAAALLRLDPEGTK
jgi:hypothetical protein